MKKPLRVLLVSNFASDKQFSMLGYAGVLFRGLQAAGYDVRMTLPTPRITASPLARKPATVQKWLAYLDKYLLYPKELRKEIREWKPDLIHVCDQGNGMYIPYVVRLPHLITCHDLLAIRAMRGEISEEHLGPTGKTYQRLILKGLKQAKNMVCVSTASKIDAIALIETSASQQAAVILNGLFSDFRPMPEAERFSLLKNVGITPDRPFLLHVGGNQFYKNRPGMLRLYAELQARLPEPMPLIMTGKPFPASLRRLKEELKLNDVVQELSGVDNSTLQALYSQARALIFPSLYEGFGLPIIEAMACGCPVFTSNREPMMEIGDRAAIYFDPTEFNGAAATIAEALNNPGSYREMAQAGLENIRQRFTTERMMNEYSNYYQTLAM